MTRAIPPAASAVSEAPRRGRARPVVLTRRPPALAVSSEGAGAGDGAATGACIMGRVSRAGVRPTNREGRALVTRNRTVSLDREEEAFEPPRTASAARSVAEPARGAAGFAYDGRHDADRRAEPG